MGKADPNMDVGRFHDHVAYHPAEAHDGVTTRPTARSVHERLLITLSPAPQ